MLKKTTAQSKILALRKRIRIVQGGTSSSKTFSIIPLLINYAITTNATEISIVAESIPHLRRGAIRDFKKIMQFTGLWNEAQFNKTLLRYEFTNGSFIEFFSAGSSDALRGARRDVLFINECNNVTFEAYKELAIRTRKFIYLDYNPVAPFWVDEHLLEDKDASRVILTYKDNEALEPAIIAEIEKARDKAETSKYWANWWRVYGLGLTGALQGAIFNDWVQIDKIPEAARLQCYGLDFGFSNDEAAVIAVYYLDGKYIFKELIYQKGLTNKDLAELMKAKGVDRSTIIYADSAEPKSIEELKRYGLRIIGVKKPKGSVNFGIQLLQQEPFSVLSSSLNLIKELRNYTWATDKAGQSLNKPIDAFNHLIDAARYAVTGSKKVSGKYVYSKV